MTHLCPVSLLVLYLLTPPHQSASLPPESEAGWHVLKQWNLAYQIAGPHERYGAWATEVAYSRGYYHELKGAPRLEAGELLPTQEQCEVELNRLRRERDRLEREARGVAFQHRRDKLLLAVQSVRDQMFLWERCLSYRRTEYSWVTRRMALWEILH